MIDPQISVDPAFTFRTEAQTWAQRHNAVLSHYFRRESPVAHEDPLCAAALKGDWPAAEKCALFKTFPFIRCASVFQVPLTEQWRGAWLVSAFLAGLLYGKRFPAQAEELSEQTLGGHDYLRPRIQRLKDELGGQPLTFDNLGAVFVKLGKGIQPADGVSAEQFAARTAFISILAGGAAATTARHDPELCEFAERLSALKLNPLSPLHLVLLRSLVDAETSTLSRLIQHPLLLLAEQGLRRAEKQVVLPFLHWQLADFGVRTDDQCPVKDQDLERWVRAGLNYAEAALAQRPELFRNAFRRLAPDQRQEWRVLAETLLAIAGGLNAGRLVEAFLVWHKTVCGWVEPNFYGQALLRVFRAGAIAVWLPWMAVVLDEES